MPLGLPGWVTSHRPLPARAGRGPRLLGVCLPWESPRHRPPGARCRRRDPGAAVFVCANDPGVISLVPQPCTPCVGASTLTADSRPVDEFHAPSIRRLFVLSDDSAHFCVLHTDTILQVGSLKLRWQCRTKVIRVMTSEVFLGQRYWLRMSCLTVLWETSKEHHSQFGVFKEGPSPQRGQFFSVHIGFYQNLVYIGKADRGEEEEGEGQEGKRTSQTRKKDVSLSV